MRMLIAAAAMMVAGCVPALAEDTTCGQGRAASLEEARVVAASINGEVIEINDAALAQKTADMIFAALGRGTRPVASVIILKAPSGIAMAAMFGPDGCPVVGVRMPAKMLIEMVGRSA
jgi:hypothetical protein